MYRIPTSPRCRRRITPCSRKLRLRDPEQCGKHSTFCIITGPFFARERWKDEIARHQRRFQERGVDPVSAEFVGQIARARRKRSSSNRYDASDFRVKRMQSPRCFQCLVECAEDQGEHGPECAMKASDGIGQDVRMLRNRIGDPWMGELQ